VDPNNQPQPMNIDPVQPPTILSPEPPQNQPLTPAPASEPSQAPSGDDPGKGLAIAGVVLAFFFSLLGLILSIVAKKKSKAAGFNNTLATIGIVLNSIFIVLSILTIAILILITLTATGSIQDRGKSTSARTSATSLQKKLEVYNVSYDFYPTSLSELNSTDLTRISDNSMYEVSLSPITKSSALKTVGENDVDVLNLYGCEQIGNKIGYWDYRNDVVAYIYTGDATDSSNCSLVVN